ncbi:MAG: hypothetical protein AB8B93_00015 [Pseudomonadales bacterium]
MNSYSPRQIFRIDPIHRWTLFGGAALICMVPLLGGVDTAQGYQLLPAVTASAIVAPIAAVLVWLGLRPRLELTPQGLSVGRPGSMLTVPWSSIERIGAESHVHGVVLKQPVDTPSMQRQRWAATRSRYDASNYSAVQLVLISELRFINLSGYQRLLRSPEFGLVAARYGVQVSGVRDTATT